MQWPTAKFDLELGRMLRNGSECYLYLYTDK